MFINRQDAGEKIGKFLEKKRLGKNVVVFGLPRGGIIPAATVAQHLHAPLRVVFAKKIGHPQEKEYAIAAISEHGHLVDDISDKKEDNKLWLAREIILKQKEIAEEEKLYGLSTEVSLRGKVAIIVDDGMATGLTIRAAIADIRDLHPARIVVALPVAPEDTIRQIRKEVNSIFVIQVVKKFFGGVGSFYREFPQVSDKEVLRILKHTGM